MPPVRTVPRGVREEIERLEGKQEAEAPRTPEQDTAQAAPITAPETTEPVATPETQPESIITPVETVQEKQYATATPQELERRAAMALSELQRKHNEALKELDSLKSQSQEAGSIKGENERLKASLADLDRQVAELKTQLTAKKESAPEELDDEDREIIERNGYDEDAYRLMKKKFSPRAPAQAETKPEPAPVKTEARKVEPAQTDQRDTYFGTLDTLVGGSERRNKIVNDPEFARFLSFTDKGTNRPIRDIAIDADSVNDAVLMADIYKAFEAWKPTTVQNKKPSNLMPSSQGGAGDLNTNKKPIYSKAQYDAYQKQVRSGYFSTIGKSPAEAARLEQEKKTLSAEFDDAMREGRVVER
jgi:hypothetical protein